MTSAFNNHHPILNQPEIRQTQTIQSPCHRYIWLVRQLDLAHVVYKMFPLRHWRLSYDGKESLFESCFDPPAQVLEVCQLSNDDPFMNCIHHLIPTPASITFVLCLQTDIEIDDMPPSESPIDHIHFVLAVYNFALLLNQDRSLAILEENNFLQAI